MSLKLMSLNIEYARHLDKFPQVVRDVAPDILCLQEVCDYTLEEIAEKTGYAHYVFRKKITFPKGRRGISQEADFGVAIFSQMQLVSSREVLYRASDRTLPETDPDDLSKEEDRQRAQDGVILIGEYEKDGHVYTIGTLHFTWSFVTETQLQLDDARSLLDVTADIPELILCGDFNVPRGQNKSYDIFTERFIDGIPENYTMSIDMNIHEAGKNLENEHLLVDYIFHTPGYTVSNVKLIDGVSDHMAVVGEISFSNFSYFLS